MVLHNRLALKKRVYEASDWDSFRKAVEAHKAYGDYLVIKKVKRHEKDLLYICMLGSVVIDSSSGKSGF